MARKVKVKSEDFDQGDDSYKSKASSPTTPKRTTRSSSKRPANVAKLSDRSPNLYKKHKTAVKPAPVQDEKDESDEGDSTGEYTEGMEEDKNGSHSGGTDDDDEKLVEKQLASVQKEQRQKAEMKLNELHLKQREENRRREQERFERLAKHRKEKEKQLKELEENNRREQERLELLEKQRKEKEAQEKERLEEEQHRMKRERQQQERIDMYNRVKERMDLERLEKEQKEAKELHDRQLAEEQKAQKKDAAAKSLRQEAEDDDDEDSDDGDSDDEGSDEDSGDEDDGDEEDGDKNEDDEDEDDDDESKEEEEDEDKDEQEDKNLVGADAPNLANPGNEDPCACIRCIKNLAIDPLYSCDFTDNPDKCAQCTNRGRSCNPVPAFVHGAACRLLALQKQHDATHPRLREALRIRVQAEAAAIAEKVRLEGSRHRKTQDDTYRAILFGQVGIKHNQEEIIKLLRELLSRGSAEGASPVVSGRVDKKKGRA